MIESLTKENFFNQMQAKYPLAMGRFCDWIDEYKKRVNWIGLFSEGWTSNPHGVPKYHEIPIAMQFGIFIQYVVEGKSGQEKTEVSMLTMEGIPAMIENYFKGKELIAKTTS